MSDPSDDRGLELDPRQDWPAAASDPTDAQADHDADDLGALIPGAGDDQGLDDLSVDDIDEA